MLEAATRGGTGTSAAICWKVAFFVKSERLDRFELCGLVGELNSAPKRNDLDVVDIQILERMDLKFSKPTRSFTALFAQSLCQSTTLNIDACLILILFRCAVSDDS